MDIVLCAFLLLGAIPAFLLALVGMFCAMAR